MFSICFDYLFISKFDWIMLKKEKNKLHTDVANKIKLNQQKIYKKYIIIQSNTYISYYFPSVLDVLFW